MRIVVLFVALLSMSMVSAQKINWMTMDEALAAQQTKPKKIFMDVYTTWCTPCKLLDKNTFSDKNVINFINDNFYAVKFNAEGNEEITYQDFTYTNPNYQPERKGRNATHFFADALRLSGYPSLVFFADDGALIQAIPGYKSPQDLEIYLKMIASDDYKELTTMKAWEEYQENFKGTF
ncbi:MAG: thioredoxin fold domain-containing protein [Flavobacteriales bacterium]|jgi:thioredoxin-related protein|uniref:thioredoxin family protein n=1 Tax=Candidatus Ulvibacter alkanivorans TaxID=2267620 RepID=UPI000DF3E9A6|nr:thioredoxin fold domain-containing protein [Candidatus Ulvibacter alkanivorans]MCH2489302.1 thioredoxin fold domain-containing protein [Flavobacteriales bacterium]